MYQHEFIYELHIQVLILQQNVDKNRLSYA
jgi:hypothetical protein